MLKQALIALIEDVETRVRAHLDGSDTAEVDFTSITEHETIEDSFEIRICGTVCSQGSLKQFHALCSNAEREEQQTKIAEVRYLWHRDGIPGIES